MGVGILAPAIVGRPVRWKTELELEAAELSVLEGPPVVEEASELVEAVVDGAEVADEAPVDEAALVALEVAVLVFRLGKLLSVVGFWAAAKVAAKASSQSAPLMVERSERSTFYWRIIED